jgi:hypothetical protein
MGLPEPKVQRRCRAVESVMVSVSAESAIPKRSGPVRYVRRGIVAWTSTPTGGRDDSPSSPEEVVLLRQRSLRPITWIASDVARRRTAR